MKASKIISIKTCLTLAFSTCVLWHFLGAQSDSTIPKPPGVVIKHHPVSTGEFVASPSIVMAADGQYYCSHDYSDIEKGDKGDVYRTAIYSSSDKGKTWKKLAELDDLSWASLFIHRGKLHLLGTTKPFGHLVVRRSEDWGSTWSTPKDAKTGLIADDGRYHCAPTPVIIHNGRIWRAMEDAPVKREFRSFMLSAATDADLLDRNSWLMSNKLEYQTSWSDSTMQGWLEGNVVVDPDGKLVNILRCKFSDSRQKDKVAMVHVTDDGKTSTFDPEKGFMSLPGGTSKKFTIRYDVQSKKYWALVNWIQPRDEHLVMEGLDPGKLRNCLALASSENLIDWTLERVILYHPDHKKHAFQYVDWVFDGKDIIAVSRTAFDDEEGGADNYHDANFITFHRVVDFRKNLNE